MMANGHFLNGATIPAEIAANLKEILPEFGDLDHEELLQHQECVLQSLKGYENKEHSDGHSSNFSQRSNFSQVSGQGGESSRHGSFDQLALDEAFARSLQEVDDHFDDFDITQSSSASHSATAREVRNVSSRETPEMSTNFDDVDLDNMSYEQLQSLGDAVGCESKGLPDEVISRLPRYKYKTGIFFKKKEKQECVICFMEFKNGDKLISLPCAHQYHSKCIKRWLQEKKTCPVCQEEVKTD